MAVKTKEDLLKAINDRFKEDTTDETISLIEDVTDTFTDLETKAKGDGKDWQAEAKRIDEEWRAKYKARFFSGKVEETEPDDEPEPKNYTFENLFKEE